MHTLNNHPRRARGFTLLEVMIALVVFSIGLLGVAGLQVAGMRFTQGSQLRALAIMQAENMADRMRANLLEVYPDGRPSSYNRSDGSIPSTYTDCDTADCTPEQLADYDLATWNNPRPSGPAESNADVLPNGAGIVCIDATPDDGVEGAWACDNVGTVYAIKVTWTERTIGADDRGDTNDDGTADDIDRALKRIVMRVVP